MVKKIKIYLYVILFLALLSFLIPITHVSPDHAQVFVDDITKKYYSPPCFSLLLEDVNNNHLIQRFRLTTRKEAFALEYSPDRDCRNNDGFIQDEQLGMLILRRMRILKEHSRWNEDGTWNW